MRILMISQFYPPRLSGYGVQCAAVARLLVERGHEVCVLAGAAQHVEPAGNEKVLPLLGCCPVEGYQDATLKHVWQYLRHQVVFRENRSVACAVAREFNPDVVMVWQFDSLGPDLVQGLRETGIPVVFNVEDVFLGILGRLLRRDRHVVWQVARDVLYRPLVRLLAGAPLIMISEELRTLYLGEGFSKRQMTVIHHGIDSRHLAAGPPETGPGNRLLYAGRVHPWKGVHVALQALAVLNATRPARFTLDIVGEGPEEYEAELRRLAGRLHLRKSLRFLGSRDRETMMTLYGNYDMVLVPSVWHEGGPFVVIEAMAHGVPVIASDMGGPRDIITHGVDGLLVEPENPQALAKDVIRLSERPNLRRRMAEGAIAKVRAKFALGAHVDRTEALLARVVGREG